MTRGILGLVAGLGLGLAGCTTIDTGSSSVPGIDWTRYKSFTQTAPLHQKMQGVPGYSAIAADRIQSEIARNLEMKGMRKTGQDDADIVVRFSVSGKPQTDVWGDPGYGWYGGGTVQTTHYIKGTLTIDVFDAQKKELVWHGWGSADIFSSDADGSLIPKAVEKILADFPPSS